MSCNLATTQAAACVSGIGKLTDPLSLLRVIAENFAESSFAGNSANTNSVDDIMARACASGIGKLTDELALWRIIAQNLCALSNGDTPVEPYPNTIILSGAGLSTYNQTYIRASSNDAVPYIGVTEPQVTIEYDSTSGLFRVLALGSVVLYIQSGNLPTNWTVSSGTPPAPTGVFG